MSAAWQQAPPLQVPREAGSEHPAPRYALQAAAEKVWSLALLLWSRGHAVVAARRATQRARSLQLIETVSLGEKRFVAVVQVEQARFLIGGGATGVSLLARLEPEPAPKPSPFSRKAPEALR